MKQQGFFDLEEEKEESSRFSPLAHRMRPKKLEEIVGQKHILDKGGALYQMILEDNLSSTLLYGPPGTGKTTIASVIAKESDSYFSALSAVNSGVKELREVVEEAKKRRQFQNRGTILFIDEIHRFNKSQQDALLPHVEKGTIILIGATTENPFFSVNRALLSRMQVFELFSLEKEDLKNLIYRAMEEDVFLSDLPLDIEEDVLDYFVNIAGGDGRFVLGALESVIMTGSRVDGKISVDLERAKEILQTSGTFYDKDGDYHYDTISAFIKSVRGSDPDAALYYLARMIEGGEDPLFIARRLIILASEDIGLADNNGLNLAASTLIAVQNIGMPEGRIPLAQCTLYLCGAEKSNTAYRGIDEALNFVKSNPRENIPLHIRDTHYYDGKSENIGEDYLNPHNYKGALKNQEYLPEIYRNKKFYYGKENGEEKKILDRFRSMKENSD